MVLFTPKQHAKLNIRKVDENLQKSQIDCYVQGVVRLLAGWQNEPMLSPKKDMIHR